MSGAEFAGTLRERVVIERLVPQRSATGLQVMEWVLVAEAFAAVVPDGAGPEGEAGALSALARYRLTIRHPSGATVGDRARWRDRAMLIRQVLLDPRQGDRMVLRCEEVRS